MVLLVLQTLIPIPVVGTILGGFIGEYVGDLLGTQFFGGGIKEAGAKLGKDILGIFTGVGKGAKAIFDIIGGIDWEVYSRSLLQILMQDLLL